MNSSKNDNGVSLRSHSMSMKEFFSQKCYWSSDLKSTAKKTVRPKIKKCPTHDQIQNSIICNKKRREVQKDLLLITLCSFGWYPYCQHILLKEAIRALGKQEMSDPRSIYPKPFVDWPFHIAFSFSLCLNSEKYKIMKY